MDILKRFISVGILLIVLLLALKALFLGTYPDFRTFYFGPSALLAGQNPYVPGGNYTEFLYPPFALVFFLPFSLFPFSVMEKVWVIVSIGLLLAGIGVILKLFKRDIFSNDSLLLAALA